jgi:hypothetical protein
MGEAPLFFKEPGHHRVIAGMSFAAAAAAVRDNRVVASPAAAARHAVIGKPTVIQGR